MIKYWAEYITYLELHKCSLHFHIQRITISPSEMPLMTSLVISGRSVSIRDGFAGSEAAGPSAGEAPVASASPTAATPEVPPRGPLPPANAAADVPVPSLR